MALTIALFSSQHLWPVLNLGSGTLEVLESPMSMPQGLWETGDILPSALWQAAL